MPEPRYAAMTAVLLLAAVGGAQTPAKTNPQTPASPAAQPAPANPQLAEASKGHVLEAADLESFFDGILPLQLERSDIAGSSVLVMKDGKVLLEKGYGYSDWQAKKAVDPEKTIFRLASISKLFTWISIMQLEEQGKVDLDADVNRYLDFQIRPAFGEPVTLRNLMTHTGGFEETINDVLVTDEKKKPSLRDYIIANQPRRMFPPGEVPAYSNYGVGLASYIVQRIAGEPFEQYVHDHIFAPLGMTHSSFHQPLEKALAGLPSEGYRSNPTKPAVGFEIFSPVGAGGISSTASDMGRFGQALLNGGELEGHRILKAETLALMWTPQFRASDQLAPICMGFYQDWRNGLRWIGHEGDLIAFHSLFFVEPTQKLVIFVSYNSAAGGGLPRPEIIDFFSDRYFAGAPKVEFLKSWPAGMRGIAGRYEITRRADSTKLAIDKLFSQRTVSISKDGVLKVSEWKDLRGHPVAFKPIGNDLWQSVDEQQRLFAIRDGAGRVVRCALDFPGVQLERVPWYEDSRWVGPALALSLLTLALVVLATLVRLGRRLFFRKRPRPQPQPGTIWLTLGPRITALAWIILLCVLAGVALAAGDDAMPPTPDWFKWFVLLNWATGIAMFFSFFAIVAGIRVWWRADLRWITRVKFSLVGLACLILCWFAWHWNLIGPAHRI